MSIYGDNITSSKVAQRNKKGVRRVINSELLKNRAKELGVRQQDIADALGLKQSSLNLKLNNRRPMSLEEAEIIAGMLGIGDDAFASYFFAGSVA